MRRAATATDPIGPGRKPRLPRRLPQTFLAAFLFLAFAGTGRAESPAVWRTPGIPRMISIPAGNFRMGSPENEPAGKVDEIRHDVVLTQSFQFAATEVTQALWQQVSGTNPGYFAPCDSCPVENVTWFDAVRFCNDLSLLEGLEPAYEIDGEKVDWRRESTGFRLPTEAEWEHACRAHSVTPFAFGACLTTDQANFNGYHTLRGCPTGMNRGEAIEVGRFPPNGWGLLDMHGNVAEWCWDVYGDYPSTRCVDPIGPPPGPAESRRVFRGGSFLNYLPKCRSAAREALDPARRVDVIGLRLARNGSRR